MADVVVTQPTQPTSNKKWYQRPAVWVGMLISILSIILLFGLVDNVPALIDGLREANPAPVLVAVAALCIAVYLRAMRWQSIINAPTNFWQVFHADNIGFFANMVLPLRAGEAIRAYTISRQQPALSIVGALSTVVVDRVVDLLAVIMVLGLVLPALAVPDPVKVGGYTMLILVAIALIVMVIGAYAHDRLVAFARAVLTRLLPHHLANRLVSWFDDLLTGFAVLRSPRRLIWMTVTTAGMWTCYVVFYHFVLAAFVPNPPVAWAALTTAAAAFGMAAPSSPGFIGVFHFAVTVAMKPYIGDKALAYAVVLHAVEVIIMVLFGIYSLAATGTSLWRMSAVADSATNAERAAHAEHVEPAGN
jgi:uncharacterized protein (TIRG00374 family)